MSPMAMLLVSNNNSCLLLKSTKQFSEFTSEFLTITISSLSNQILGSLIKRFNGSLLLLFKDLNEGIKSLENVRILTTKLLFTMVQSAGSPREHCFDISSSTLRNSVVSFVVALVLKILASLEFQFTQSQLFVKPCDLVLELHALCVGFVLSSLDPFQVFSFGAMVSGTGSASSSTFLSTSPITVFLPTSSSLFVSNQSLLIGLCTSLGCRGSVWKEVCEWAAAKSP